MTTCKVFAVAVVATVSGCMTTSYRLPQPEAALRPKVTVVRHCSATETEHYFALGVVALQDERNIRAACGLKADEALMNGSVTNKQGGLDATYTVLGSLFTFGVLNPIIWTSRTSVIEGDVIKSP